MDNVFLLLRAVESLAKSLSLAETQGMTPLIAPKTLQFCMNQGVYI